MLGGSMKVSTSAKRASLGCLQYCASEHPDGVYATEDVLAKFRDTPANPFEISTDTPLSSPSSSDEELYTDALQLTTPTIVPAQRKPPPPPPPIRNVKTPTSDT